MWLASISLRDRFGKIIPTENWDDRMRATMESLLDRLLEGVGDPLRERQIRMCITMCRHRAITQREFERLPQWWHDAPAVDLAGGPLEVMWHKGIPETLSTQPCVNPTKEPFGGGLYLPVDCGECPSCRAREACSPRYG